VNAHHGCERYRAIGSLVTPVVQRERGRLVSVLCARSLPGTVAWSSEPVSLGSELRILVLKWWLCRRLDLRIGAASDCASWTSHRPMRRLNATRLPQSSKALLALIQNFRRRHDEVGTETGPHLRLSKHAANSPRPSENEVMSATKALLAVAQSLDATVPLSDIRQFTQPSP